MRSLILKDENENELVVSEYIRELVNERNDLRGALIVVHDAISNEDARWLKAQAKRKKFFLSLSGAMPKITIWTREDEKKAAAERRREYEAEQERINSPG